jgi:hypothetical protein
VRLQLLAVSCERGSGSTRTTSPIDGKQTVKLPRPESAPVFDLDALYRRRSAKSVRNS